jgi:hypothetical protein
VTDPTPTDLPALLAYLARHERSEAYKHRTVCAGCGAPWPCDAARAAELERLQPIGLTPEDWARIADKLGYVPSAELERVTAERDALAEALNRRTHEFAAPANKPRVGTERCDGWACGREKDNPVHHTPARVLAKPEPLRAVELTRAEGRAMFDREARRITGMSGEEFLEKYDRGEIAEIDPDVMGLLMLLPFVREVPSDDVDNTNPEEGQG